MRHSILTFLVFVLCLAPLSAEKAHTPKAGSKERTSLLDAVRDPLEDHVFQKVIFRVSHLKVKDDWAFLLATARTLDDKPLDFKGTALEEDSVGTDEAVVALLRKKRDRWYVVTSGYFATGVWWLDLEERYRAPKEIFPNYEKKP